MRINLAIDNFHTILYNLLNRISKNIKYYYVKVVTHQRSISFSFSVKPVTVCSSVFYFTDYDTQ